MTRSRSFTISMKELKSRRNAAARAGVEMLDDEERALLRELEVTRPRTRGDCVAGERPCPFLSCKHHLYLDVDPARGSIKFNFPDKELHELEHTCALDVADLGGITLENVGSLFNLTRERIRQVEERAAAHINEALEVA